MSWNTIPACQPDRGLSAGIDNQRSPTIRRPLQTIPEWPPQITQFITRLLVTCVVA
jgi:hypothetical protein